MLWDFTSLIYEVHVSATSDILALSPLLLSQVFNSKLHPTFCINSNSSNHRFVLLIVPYQACINHLQYFLENRRFIFCASIFNKALSPVRYCFSFDKLSYTLSWLCFSSQTFVDINLSEHKNHLLNVHYFLFLSHITNT